jgi:hypothetical protein
MTGWSHFQFANCQISMSRRTGGQIIECFRIVGDSRLKA